MHGEYFAEGSQFNRIATRYVMFASYIIVKKAEKVNIGGSAAQGIEKPSRRFKFLLTKSAGYGNL